MNSIGRGGSNGVRRLTPTGILLANIWLKIDSTFKPDKTHYQS
jgi:hypothetical protein